VPCEPSHKGDTLERVLASDRDPIKEEHMPDTNEQPVGGAAIMITFGTIFIVLIGLVAFEPKIGPWIVSASEAEMAWQIPDRPTPTRVAATPKRRPIEPGAWGEVATSKMADSGRR
jgi:hypothetical protein